MNLSALLARYRQWRDNGTRMVLAIVVRAEGSTYAKPGAMMLISEHGEYEGLLSGGCLEGDLMSRAAPVFASGTSADVVYDMRDQEHDQLWGLGLGCGGMMQIRLSALEPDAEYFPLGAIDAAVGARQSPQVALLITNNRGAGLCRTADLTQNHGLTGKQGALLEKLAMDCERPHVAATAVGEVFVAAIPLPTRLLILGAGPDAVPLAQLALGQGWELKVVDHRPAYAAQFVAAGGPQITVLRPDTLASALDLDSFDAAVVMSHHLATDHTYLQCLADTGITYIGSLGPSDRRDQLLEDLQPELGNDLVTLRQRLYAPIGLDIGARGPEGIALAICAQIQGALSGRDAGHLGPPSQR